MIERLKRFTLAERAFHWGNAASLALLGLTGLLIWAELDKWRPWKINVVAQAHSLLGGGVLLLCVLLFLGLRRDRVTNSGRRFNMGQRINLRLSIGIVAIQAVLGVVLYALAALDLAKDTRELLQIIHLGGAVFISLLVAAHLFMVFVVPKNRGIFASMWTGYVDRKIAERVSPEWTAAIPQQHQTTTNARF